MTQQLKFVGPINPSAVYEQGPIVGRPGTWLVGENKMVLDADAALLLATGYFTSDNVPVAFNPTTAALTAGGIPILSALAKVRTTPLRCATFGDSTANANPVNTDVSLLTTTFATHTNWSISPEKWGVPNFYPQAWLVANGGISGQTTAQMLARDTLTPAVTRKAIQDVLDLRPEVVFLRGGSINDITTVTSGTVASTVAATYANHVQIINRFLEANVIVIDEGIYGYSGAGATDPVSTRAALVQLNALFATYAASLPGKLYFLSPTNLVSDANGNFLNTCVLADGNGIHLGIWGQYLMSQAEGSLLASIFGQSANTRWQGKNLLNNAATVAVGGNNSLFANTTSPGYGTQPLGFAVGVSNGTRQNASIRVLNGKQFFCCQIAPSATSNYLAIYCPMDTTNWAPAQNEIWTVEHDVYLANTIDGPPPQMSGLIGQWDFTNGGNTITLNMLQATQTFTASGPMTWKVTYPAFQIPTDISGALTACELYVQATSADAAAQWQLGISNPRLVKLGTTTTWPPVAP